MEIFSALHTLKEEVENYKSPDGTEKHPARTCKDLMGCHNQHQEHKELKNGKSHLTHSKRARFNLRELVGLCTGRDYVCIRQLDT